MNIKVPLYTPADFIIAQVCVFLLEPSRIEAVVPVGTSRQWNEFIKRGGRCVKGVSQKRSQHEVFCI
jgi:hypothetical protein